MKRRAAALVVLVVLLSNALGCIPFCLESDHGSRFCWIWAPFMSSWIEMAAEGLEDEYMLIDSSCGLLE